MKSHYTPWLYFVGSVLCGLVMINSDSLWIDEGQTLHFARQPTLSAWVGSLRESTKSEAHMPLGMLAAWMGGRVLGLGEWDLRAINLAWLGLAGVAIGLSGRRLGCNTALPLFLIHPFLWLYVNEARPYVMQICAGAWLVYAFITVFLDRVVRPNTLWIFFVAATAGYGSSLLFAFPLAGFLVVSGLCWWRGNLDREWSRSCWAPIAAGILALGALTGYFAYTLAKGATSAKIWTVSPLNLGFAVYEALGFSGSGPPRIELRELAHNPPELLRRLLQVNYLSGFLILGSAYGLIGFRLWKIRSQPVLRALIGIGLVSGALLFVASVAAAFPFWGRHLAPVFPVVVLVLALGLAPVANDRTPYRSYVALGLLFIGLGAASLNLRLNPRYRRDDYRTACALAKKAIQLNKVVWWSADPDELPAYYGITPELAAAHHVPFILVYNPPIEQFKQWPAPDLVISSKPDLFDWQGHLGRFLAQGGFQIVRRLPAFTVWVPPGSTLGQILNQPDSDSSRSAGPSPE